MSTRSLSASSSQRSTTTAVENGSSSVVSSSTFSRMRTATRKRSGWMVSSSGSNIGSPPGQEIPEHVEQTVAVVPLARADGHDLREQAGRAVALHDGQQLGLLHPVHLV